MVARRRVHRVRDLGRHRRRPHHDGARVRGRAQPAHRHRRHVLQRGLVARRRAHRRLPRRRPRPHGGVGPVLRADGGRVRVGPGGCRRARRGDGDLADRPARRSRTSPPTTPTASTPTVRWRDWSRSAGTVPTSSATWWCAGVRASRESRIRTPTSGIPAAEGLSLAEGLRRDGRRSADRAGLPQPAGLIMLSPEGDRAFVQFGQDIFIVDLAEVGATPPSILLTNLGPRRCRCASSPTWAASSPRGHPTVQHCTGRWATCFSPTTSTMWRRRRPQEEETAHARALIRVRAMAISDTLSDKRAEADSLRNADEEVPESWRTKSCACRPTRCRSWPIPSWRAPTRSVRRRRKSPPGPARSGTETRRSWPTRPPATRRTSAGSRRNCPATSRAAWSP